MYIGRISQLLSYILLFFSSETISQSLQTTIRSSPYVSFFSVADGLPSNEVYDLEVDEFGVLWICTDNGVAKYDGISFEKMALPRVSQTVLGVEKSPDGNLWFFTIKSELFSCDPKTGICTRQLEHLNIADSLNGKAPIKLHFDRGLIVLISHREIVEIANWNAEPILVTKSLLPIDSTALGHVLIKEFPSSRATFLKDSLFEKL